MTSIIGLIAALAIATVVLIFLRRVMAESILNGRTSQLIIPLCAAVIAFASVANIAEATGSGLLNFLAVTFAFLAGCLFLTFFGWIVLTLVGAFDEQLKARVFPGVIHPRLGNLWRKSRIWKPKREGGFRQVLEDTFEDEQVTTTVPPNFGSNPVERGITLIERSKPQVNWLTGKPYNN